MQCCARWAWVALIGLCVCGWSQYGFGASLRNPQNESGGMVFIKNVIVIKSTKNHRIIKFLWNRNKNYRSALCCWSDPIQKLNHLIFWIYRDIGEIAKADAVSQQLSGGLSVVVDLQHKIFGRHGSAWQWPMCSHRAGDSYKLSGATPRNVSSFYLRRVFQQPTHRIGLLAHGPLLRCGSGGVVPRRSEQPLHVARLDAGVPPQSVRCAPKIEGEDSEGDCRERSDCSLILVSEISSADTDETRSEVKPRDRGDGSGTTFVKFLVLGGILVAVYAAFEWLRWIDDDDKSDNPDHPNRNPRRPMS